MKQFKQVFFIAVIVLVNFAIYSHEGKPTYVLKQMIQIHESLVKDSSKPVNVSSLISLLSKGGEGKKDGESFKKSLPVAKKLETAKDEKSRLEAFAELSEILSAIVGYHDKSGASVFYCPMVKKKWIAKGNEVVNPYYKDMRDCGERIP